MTAVARRRPRLVLLSALIGSTALTFAVTACSSDEGPAASVPDTSARTTSPVDAALTTGATTEPPASTTTMSSTTTTSAGPETTASTAVAPTSTTEAPANTIDQPPAVPEDEALAVAATLQASTFPPAWVVYAEGQPSTISTESCSYRPGGALELVPEGSSQSGPTMQLGDTGAFVSSFSLVFPEESLAVEHIGVVNTEVWGACRAGQLQQFQDDNATGATVSITSRDDPSLGQNGFEGFVEFAISGADGQVQRYVQISLYRLGRVVLGVTSEYGSLSDADFATLTNDGYAALVAAYDRINELQP